MTNTEKKTAMLAASVLAAAAVVGGITAANSSSHKQSRCSASEEASLEANNWNGIPSCTQIKRYSDFGG